MAKRHNWTYDELVLAADLAARNEWARLDTNDPQVIELSELLQLGPVPLDDRHASFRSPGSVSRKLSDIVTRHPDFHGKPTNGNKLDGVVLEAFLADPVGMHFEAEVIRERFGARLRTFALAA